jgi:hypothetical protein
MSRSGARWLAGVALGIAVSAARPVGAELLESIAHLAQVWQAEEAMVAVDTSRFLNEDETWAYPLPDLPPAECTTVALVGPRGLGFHLRIVGDAEEDHDARLASQAGAISLERCGVAPPRVLLVTSDSGRGALEIAVARSHHPLAGLRVVLPERAGGSWTQGPEPGPLPTLPSPEHRADVADARARRDGATLLPRATLASALDGSGGAGAILDEGCHTLRLLGVDARAAHPSLRFRLDIDAELRDHGDDRVLARDRSDAPDAELSACVGEPTEADVVFVGSPPRAPVIMTHYAWPLPAHLPTIWGSEVRGRMGRVLLARHVATLPREPFFLTQGGSGTTPVPVPVEPGGCYLAIVVATQGNTRALGLRVRVGARDAYDDRGIEGAGAAVAFCAGASQGVSAVVEAHGAPLLGWALAAYRVEDGAWELPP